MSSSFSSSDAAAISRNVDVKETISVPASQLEEFYSLQRCCEWIQQENFQKVCLQFPDELLGDAVDVVLMMQAKLGRKVYILGDTSYGSCCVDEVAAEHAQADGIIHFGHSCLSPTRRLPVLYVFTKQTLDTDHVKRSFVQMYPDQSTHVAFLCNMVYYHSLCTIYNLLKEDYENIVMGEVGDIQQDNDKGNGIVRLGRRFDLKSGTDLNSYKIFYVGERNHVLVNFMMTLCEYEFTSYDPKLKEVQQEAIASNRMLMKRYYAVEKARDAKRVGILIGTLGVADYLHIIDHLKAIAKAAGKKSYTIAVGKPNPAKLANFAEIDAYVLVACPENSSVFDSKDFFQPILTPYEFELACNSARQWSGDYVTDFRELLPGAAHFVDFAANTVPMEPDVSLITGGMRSLGTCQEEKDLSDNSSVMKRDDAMTVSTVHVGGGGEYLASRTWKGLEEKLGETSAVLVTQGRRGVASGYEGEASN